MESLDAGNHLAVRIPGESFGLLRTPPVLFLPLGHVLRPKTLILIPVSSLSKKDGSSDSHLSLSFLIDY